MSSLAYKSRTREQPSKSCIRNPSLWRPFAVPGTITLTGTVLADSDSIDLYLPADFIKPGLLVALATAGPAYAGTWVPYLPNISSANGEDTALGMVLEAAYVERDYRGSIDDAVAHVSIVPAGTPCQVYPSKMPPYNDHTAYAGGSGSSAAVTTSDLPTGFIDLDALGVANVAGL